MTSSRIPGFYRKSLAERRIELIAKRSLDSEQAIRIWDSGGMDAIRADRIVENVVGIYSLPFAVALNAKVDDQDRLIPMVVEEPSVVAAASNACKMIRAGGGFRTLVPTALMIGQIELRDVVDVPSALLSLAEEKSRLLELANMALPGLVRRGGGANDLEVRKLADDHLVVHLVIDTCDAMGANLVNTAAEAVGPRVAEITRSKLGLCILSNLTDRRMVEVSGSVPFEALVDDNSRGDGARVAEAIEHASLFAERDPYRAATHNKGIMNGVDSVVIATGNDYRAVEAGAHAFAGAHGTYRPLATWRAEDGHLTGKLVMPLAVGTVGGTLRVHEGAQTALALAGTTTAADLARLAASAGLASNLAALRALSTDGIQKGHMALHARSVAVAAGAVGDEVDQVAAKIASARNVTEEAAFEALAQLRRSALEDRGTS